MTHPTQTARGRRALPSDVRGVVYVEFVFAFMPLFVLFLAVCQLALLSMGRLVVQHAALCGARAAIVVLEDAPEHYADVPRGNLSDGETGQGLQDILASLGLLRAETFVPNQAVAQALFGGSSDERSSLQRGARMVPIRAAATMPLLLLAPNAPNGRAVASIATSLPGDFVSRLPFALEYTGASAVISVHGSPGNEELIAEPVARTAPVTVRVTFLMPCGLPLVRLLMCHELSTLLGSERSVLTRRLRHAQGAAALRALVPPSARFVVLDAETTLPNQGAGYDHPEES